MKIVFVNAPILTDPKSDEILFDDVSTVIVNNPSDNILGYNYLTLANLVEHYMGRTVKMFGADGSLMCPAGEIVDVDDVFYTDENGNNSVGVEINSPTITQKCVVDLFKVNRVVFI